MEKRVIDEWVNNVSNIDVKVWVENPETLKESGLMGKTYTTFRVLLKATDGELVGVRHRYSEFDSLRSMLQKRYAQFGILVPSLPQKKVLGKLDQDFITERMQGLTLFCEAVVANPWLRQDKYWKDFMTSGSTVVSTQHLESERNIAEEMLLNILDKLTIPVNPLERMVLMKEEIKAMEKALNAISDSTRNVQKALSTLHTANHGFHAAVVQWGNAEENAKLLCDSNTELSTGFCALRQNEQTLTLANRLGQLCAEKHATTNELADYNTILVTTAIEHELSRCESFKEMIKIHDELCSSIDSWRVKCEKLEASQNAKWEQLQESKRNLELKTIALNNFYKGFFYFSIPLAVKQRSFNFRRALSAIGAGQYVAAFALQNSAVQFLTDLDMNILTSISDASYTLDILGIKPFVQPPESVIPKINGMPPTKSWFEALYRSALASSGQSSSPTNESSQPSSPSKTSPTVILAQEEATKPASPEKANPFLEDNTPPPPVEVETIKEEKVEAEPPQPPVVQKPVNSAILNDLTDGLQKTSAAEKSDLWG